MKTSVKALLLTAFLSFTLPAHGFIDMSQPRTSLIAAVAAGLLAAGSGTLALKDLNEMRRLERELALSKLGQAQARSNAEFKQASSSVTHFSESISKLRKRLWWFAIPAAALGITAAGLGVHSGIQYWKAPAKPEGKTQDSLSSSNSSLSQNHPAGLAPTTSKAAPGKAEAAGLLSIGNLPSARNRSQIQHAQYDELQRAFRAAGITDHQELKRAKNEVERQKMFDGLSAEAQKAFGEELRSRQIDDQAMMAAHATKTPAPKQADATALEKEPFSSASVSGLAHLPARTKGARALHALSIVPGVKHIPAVKKTAKAEQERKRLASIMQVAPRTLADKDRAEKTIEAQWPELPAQKRVALKQAVEGLQARLKPAPVATHQLAARPERTPDEQQNDAEKLAELAAELNARKRIPRVIANSRVTRFIAGNTGEVSYHQLKAMMAQLRGTGDVRGLSDQDKKALRKSVEERNTYVMSIAKQHPERATQALYSLKHMPHPQQLK